MSVTLNNVHLSVTYYTSATGCFKHEVSTIALTLASGSNTLVAQIADQAGNVGANSAVFTYTPPTYTVTVTSDSTSTESRAPRIDGLQSFSVRNTGTAGSDYSLSASCANAAFASCAVPGAVHVDAGQVTHVWASYTTGSAQASGSLTVRAVSLTDTTVSGSGSQTVSVTTAPVIVDATPLAWTGLDRSQCVAIEVVRSVASECDAIRITHPLPSVTTLNKVRTPTLVYYTDEVYGGAVAANVTVPGTPDSVTFNVYSRSADGTVSPTPIKGRTYNWRQLSQPNATQRLALDGVTNITGLFRYRLELKSWSNNVAQILGIVDGEMLETFRQADDFGAGWWLAGVEQLVLGQGGSSNRPDSLVAWIGGDGSMQKYVWQSTSGTRDTYLAAHPVDRPDTLIKDSSQQTPWVRKAFNNLRVLFDAYGRHALTVNRTSDTTQFFWKAGGSLRLDSLEVPSDTARARSSYATYRFSYDASDRLTSVTPPPIGTTTRIVRLVRDTLNGVLSNGIRKIIEPSGDSVVFEWASWAPHDYYYGARRDRRGVRTQIDWEPSGPGLGTASTHNNPAGTTTHTLRNASNIGTGLTSVPVLIDSVYTRYTDPRSNVTKFWVSPLGAPAKIVNALGQTTIVRRDNTIFPGLATEVIAPSGLVTRGWYSARGITDSTTVFAPYGDARNSTTRIHWDAVWTMATNVIHPAGDSDSLAYDPATGNRLWEQPGGDATRRVSYSYYANNQLSGIQLPGDTTHTVLKYDASRHDLSEVITRRGYHTKYYTDTIGRDTLVQHQITPNDLSNWQTESRTLDAMDRPLTQVSAGPALNGVSIESATVSSTFDPEGNVLSVTRTFTPDGGIGALTTSWVYDSLGHALAEYAPKKPGDATVYRDSSVYDVAGNPVTQYTRRGLTITMQYDALNRLYKRVRPAVQYDSVAPTLGDARSTDIKIPKYPRYAIGSARTTVAADSDSIAYSPTTGAVSEADNPNARVTRTYWPNGQLRSEQLALRDYADTLWGHAYLTSYTYDVDGRRSTLVHPKQLTPGGLGGSTQYAYDPLTGQPSSVTDILGNSAAFGYDLAGDLTSINYPGGLTNHFGYDLDANLTGDTLLATSPSATYRASTQSHDARGKLTSYANAQGWADNMAMSYSGLGHVVHTFYTATRDGYPYVTDPMNPYSLFESEEWNVYDGLGNILADSSRTGGSTGWGAYNARYNAYEAGTSRLLNARELTQENLTRKPKFVYDSAGNTRLQPDSTAFSWQSGGPSEERAQYYDADGRLVAADWRSVNWDMINQGKSHWTFDRYRYDALGRRVFVYSRRACDDPDEVNASYIECDLGFARRVVWDGTSELYEIQMPDEAGKLENDTAIVKSTQPQFTSTDYWDAQTYFGRVAYTAGVGIDQPLDVVRINYADSSTGSGSYPNRTAAGFHRWNAFAFFPLWNARGQVEALWFPAMQAFYYAESDNTSRHVIYAFPQTWYPWARLAPTAAAPQAPLSWMGSLLEDKRDKTGLLYRRNRMYDPTTGRFTQEDPIGLAGGLNSYGFAAGDPVSYSDPFGLCPGTGGNPLAVCPYRPGVLGATLIGIVEAARQFWRDHGEELTYIAAVLATEGVASEGEGSPGGRLRPDANAEGAPHTTFKRDPQTGRITKYETYEPQSNPRNPNPYESTKRFDSKGEPHFNKRTNQDVPTPHVHDPSTPGGIRPARPEEIPNP